MVNEIKAVTGCSDLLYYSSFLWWSVTVLIKDDGASDGYRMGYTHARVSACQAPPTVQASPRQQAIPQDWGRVSLLFSARLAGRSPSSTNGV